MDRHWGLRPGADAYTRVHPHDDGVVPMQRRKRVARSPSPDDDFFTARDVRETCVPANRPRRKTAHVDDTLSSSATFDIPQGVTRRLAERASPRTPTMPRHRISTPALRAQKAALTSGGLPYGVADTLPLSPEGVHLLELHVGIEQCLLVHMATSGAPGAEYTEELLDDRIARRVRIPNLISFSALRPMVERASRRSMQPDDFRRVAWIWSNPVTSEDWAAESDEHEMPPAQVHGMGFLVTRTRAFDGRRRGYDWGIGIELWYNRPAPPPLEVGFGTEGNNVAPSTPPRRRNVGVLASPPTSPLQSPLKSPGKSPVKSPGRSPGKADMSNIAIWNHGLEERRTEFTRRLRLLTAYAHRQWASQTQRDEPLEDMVTPGVRAAHGALAKMMQECTPQPPPPLPPKQQQQQQLPVPPLTPPESQSLLEGSPFLEMPSTPQSMRISAGYRLGPGGVLTPGPTRSGKHAQRVTQHALEPPESPLASRTAPGKSRILVAWHPDFMACSDTLAIVPHARLPMLQAVPRKIVEHEPVVADAPAPAPAAAAATNAALPATPSARPSLEERIRAKEEARKRAAAQPGRQPTSLKHQAVLSRLGEFADALYLLFTTAPVPAVHTRTGAQSSKLPFADVLTTLENSAKIALGRRESRDAVSKLMELVPGWLDLSTVGGVEWLGLHNDPSSGRGLRDVREKIAQAAAAARVP